MRRLHISALGVFRIAVAVVLVYIFLVPRPHIGTVAEDALALPVGLSHSLDSKDIINAAANTIEKSSAQIESITSSRTGVPDAERLRVSPPSDDDIGLDLELAASTTAAADEENDIDEDTFSDVVQRPQARGARRVLVVNSPTSGFDTVFALLNVLGDMHAVNLTLATSAKGRAHYDAVPWLNTFAREHVDIDVSALDSPTSAAEALPKAQDLVVLASCALDLLAMSDALEAMLQSSPAMRVMCVVDDARVWGKEGGLFYSHQQEVASRYISTEQWIFATVAPHVGTYLRKTALADKADAKVVQFDPVFVLPDEPATPRLALDPAYVAVVGTLDVLRRDYTKVLADYEFLRPFMEVHLIGTGLAGQEFPVLATELRSLVKYRLNLTYTEYYAEVAGAMAVLPAWRDANFEKSYASTTLATALTALTPPVESRAMAAAYGYVPEYAGWLRSDAEAEMGAVVRAGFLGRTAWAERKLRMREARRAAVDRNRALMEATLAAIPEAEEQAAR
ncbi:uncharacterized protein V1518DRAFT_414176 [Limtongia smithiae]|uniref:uncharacterized protein n=1 Tax=Limtongia smithiae TaxID=1125753 RepID=UPI0034CDC73F